MYLVVSNKKNKACKKSITTLKAMRGLNKVRKRSILALALSVSFVGLLQGLEAKPLSYYIKIAEENSPVIRSQIHKTKQAKELYKKESLFVDNPILSLGYQNIPLSSFPSLNAHAMSGVNVSVSQKFAFPWEDVYRKKAFYEKYLSQKEQVGDIKAQVERNVTLNYHNLYFFYKEEEILIENKQALKDIIRVAQALVSVNKMNSSQLLKLEGDLALIDNKILKARALIKKAEADMDQIVGKELKWGKAETGNWLLKAAAVEMPSKFDYMKHPFYKRAKYMVAVAKANTAHEKAALFPSITLSGGYTFRQEVANKDLGEDFVSFKASTPFPLFYPLKERHRISAADEKLKSAREDLRNVELILTSSWRGESKKAANFLLALKNYEFEVVPKYLAAYRAQLGSLASSTVSLLDVLDAYRMFLDASIKQIDLYKRLQFSFANLTYLSKLSLEEKK